MTRTIIGAVFALIPTMGLMGHNLINPNFNQGANNLEGWEAFAAWSKGAAGFSSAWALPDAPVVASGNGTAVFSMNTQLASADPFWVGATQVMSFQQNFWTPNNTANVPTTTDLYGLTITFSGIAQVTQAYAPGNLGEVFIQFLDTGFGSTLYQALDVSTLPASGEFSITAVVPNDGLNIIQVGFRNSGIEGTPGQMTISNLEFVAIPEPSTYAFGFGLMVLGFACWRRRRQSL
ncbi:MAG: hypothetical protein LR015_02495 [Verrucomicrobia bacterium]|nr:hypothetical protein [Verrucomicrobiota bacterium]